MKNRTKLILQKLLGFERYLFVFSIFKIFTLKWDRKENDFFYFVKQLPEGSLILDIGANIGVMTVHLARRVKGARIIAFEPVTENIRTLKRVVRFFGLKNVEVRETALGEKDGDAEVVMPVVEHVKMHGLSHMVHESIPENNAGKTYRIPVRKLDSLNDLSGNGKKISAIKMDVENYEYFVLEGAMETLRSDRPLIYSELWENENRKKCFDLMKGLGYSVYVLVNGKLQEFTPGMHRTQNFFLVHSTEGNTLH